MPLPPGAAGARRAGSAPGSRALVSRAGSVTATAPGWLAWRRGVLDGGAMRRGERLAAGWYRGPTAERRGTAAVGRVRDGPVRRGPVRRGPVAPPALPPG